MFRAPSIRIVPPQCASLVLICLVVFGVSESSAQKDSVYTKSGVAGRNSLVRGNVVESTAFKVVVDDDGNRKDVPASKINKIVFAGEPRSLARAKDQFDAGRWDDCLETLAKLDKVPDSKLVKQKIAFTKAYATAAKAIRGDEGTSIAAAQQALRQFIKSNSTSYKLVVAIDLYGQLLLADGKTMEAQKEFAKLTKSKWDKYVSRGHFFEGETLVHQEKYGQATKSYQAIKSMAAADQETKQFQLLADCQLVKINAAQGKADEGIKQLLEIIQTENPDDTRLFAIAYNALGTCYLNNSETKKACRAFLHTELLFSNETDAHAEALYNLTRIWPQLKETDRANRAREMLTTRYRNTIWASKL